jgi:hypothetical protein
MAAGVAGRAAQGFPLPGDEVEVGVPRTLDDDQLAALLQRVLQFVDALVTDVGLVAEGGVSRPGDAAAVVGVDGEVEQEGAGTVAGIGLFADVCYHFHRHRRFAPFPGTASVSRGSWVFST